MKFTKQHKILGAVLIAGALAMGIDRLFVLKSAEQPAPAGATTDYAVPAVDKHNGPAKPVGPVASVAQKLRDAGKSLNGATRDAFAPGQGWQQPSTDAPRVADNSVEQFRQSHRLTGVLTSGGQSHAMIDGKMVTIGQSLDGYRLVSIDRRQATFEQGQSRIVLNMSERNTPVAGAAQ